MKKIISFFVFSMFLTGAFSMAEAQIKSWEEPLPSGPCWDEYEPGPDSLPQDGVPQGEIFDFQFCDSKIFPGTVNRISVYVPDQYDGTKPACVYVGLDGLGYRAPDVFNNLIHRGEIPLLIGIGVSPGFVPSNEFENPRFNRSFQFDGVSDAFCRFLVEEVFPEVEKKKTKKGLPILLSTNPNDRSCGGGSTGGVGAFSLAWQRPDQFRRVFSAVGTYVAMRGAQEYHVLARKTEPKPIRIFMQDGHSDQCMGDIGDWWAANLTLKRSLEFAGYDVQWVWGTGAHSGRHGTQVFPDAMRFLWKNYPEPVAAKPNPNFSPFFNQIVQENETWVPVGADVKTPLAIFSASGKGVYCVDETTRSIGIPGEDGVFEKRIALPKEAEPLKGCAGALAADGAVWLGGKFGLWVLPSGAEKWEMKAGGTTVSDLTVLENGNVYFTDAEAGKLWFIPKDGSPEVVSNSLKAPVGVGASPDFQWLAVMESETRFASSFRLEKDGKPVFGQRFYWFHTPDSCDGLGTGKCAFDADGRLYAATEIGVSVLDRNGRTRLILPSPLRGGQASVTDLCFGGDGLALFILTDGQIFVRKLKPQGVPSFLPPRRLPKWGAG